MSIQLAIETGTSIDYFKKIPLIDFYREVKQITEAIDERRKIEGGED